jgi:hypothetical protein
VGRRDVGGHLSSPAVTTFEEGGDGWLKLRNPKELNLASCSWLFLLSSQLGVDFEWNCLIKIENFMSLFGYALS